MAVMVSLLYVSGLAFAAFMGAIVGAGLILAGQKHEKALREAERQGTDRMLDSIMGAHEDVQALIGQTSELSEYNAKILTILYAATQNSGLAGLSVTGRSN